uniref:FYVE-type domain-containing protein n=1 Tax=Eptatretus burgeri TaxID=7764 RepID=A0A8C4X1I6_EPTBU
MTLLVCLCLSLMAMLQIDRIASHLLLQWLSLHPHPSYRDKDVLWQKSDMLEFEQRLRAEERFEQGDSASQCLDCRSTFSWMLRRHNCRFCRRPFCYYCCNSPIPGREGVSKERCCKSCHGIYAPASPSSSSQPGSPFAEHGQALNPPAPDDIAFDIITEDELDQSLSDFERSDEAQVGCPEAVLF